MASPAAPSWTLGPTKEESASSSFTDLGPRRGRNSGHGVCDWEDGVVILFAVSSTYFMENHMNLEIIVTWPNLITFPLSLCPLCLTLDLAAFQKLASCHSSNTGLGWLPFVMNRYFYEPQCRGIHFQRLFWNFWHSLCHCIWLTCIYERDGSH